MVFSAKNLGAGRRRFCENKCPWFETCPVVCSEWCGPAVFAPDSNVFTPDSNVFTALVHKHWLSLTKFFKQGLFHKGERQFIVNHSSVPGAVSNPACGKR